MCVSDTRSITVWRRPSRFETIEPFAALTPSVESIVPLWSWSIPRPPAGSVSVGDPGRLTVNVLADPPPCPTTLIAIVAMWARASDAATAHGAPFIESVKPWPKIATGQPPAGAVPDGTNSVKTRFSTRCTAGTPVRVPTGGNACDASS